MYLHALHLPYASLWLWHVQLFFESIVNLILLRFYYPAAVTAYLRDSRKVYKQRRVFRKLAGRFGKELLSFSQVVEMVRTNIRSKTQPLKEENGQTEAAVRI